MIEYVMMASAVLVAIASLYPKDLLKAVIIGCGIQGLALAVLYQELLAADVALTQAVIASTIMPVLFALVVYKTERWEK
jgi:energy-converting hydrogenase B subunit D